MSTADEALLRQVAQTFPCVQGPEYKFIISGGFCTLDKDTKSVTCVKPEVTLEKTAGTCTLKHTSPTTVFVSPLPACPCQLLQYQ